MIVKKFYKFIPFIAVFIVYSCGTGEGSLNEQANVQDSSNLVSENKETFSDQNEAIKVMIFSSSRNSSLTIYDAVNLSSISTRSNNLGVTTVVVPHTGTSLIQLDFSDPDSSSVYINGKIDNEFLSQHAYFSILENTGVIENLSGFDYVNNQNYDNAPFIKCNIVNQVGTLKWSFLDTSGDSEGKIFSIQNLSLYNTFIQGNTTILDLGDFFQSFDLQFNHLPEIYGKGDNDCPVNLVDIDGNGIFDRFEIPPTKDCVIAKFINIDGISYSPEYSLDNGSTYSAIDYSTTEIPFINLSLNQGDIFTKTFLVREFIDPNQAIQDEKSKIFLVYKDVDKRGNTSLIATCYDASTGNLQTVSDGGNCTFSNPGNVEIVGSISISGRSADYGTCVVQVIKNGTLKVLPDIKTGCQSITLPIPVTITSEDSGAGTQRLEFFIQKIYFGTNDVPLYYDIDKITIDYTVQ